MSEHGNCVDCGGSGGNHFDGCTYDGTDGGGHHRSSLPGWFKWVLLIGGVIFMALFPPLGVLLITVFLLA